MTSNPLREENRNGGIESCKEQHQAITVEVDGAFTESGKRPWSTGVQRRCLTPGRGWGGTATAPLRPRQVLGTFVRNVRRGRAWLVTPGKGHCGEGDDRPSPPPSTLAGGTDTETLGPLGGVLLTNRHVLQGLFSNHRLCNLTDNLDKCASKWLSSKGLVKRWLGRDVSPGGFGPSNLQGTLLSDRGNSAGNVSGSWLLSSAPPSSLAWQGYEELKLPGQRTPSPTAQSHHPLPPHLHCPHRHRG